MLGRDFRISVFSNNGLIIRDSIIRTFNKNYFNAWFPKFKSDFYTIKF